jgi:microcystin-dependent protein
MATTFSFTSTGVSTYDISYQIAWHSNALLSQQSSVEVDGVAKVFGTDYTFNENERKIIFESTKIPSSGAIIAIKRMTPSAFYATMSNLGTAAASVVLSNDEQLMKRIEETNATITSVTSGVSFGGSTVEAITVGGNLTGVFNASGNILDISGTIPSVATFNSQPITQVALGSNLTGSTFSSGTLTLIASGLASAATSANISAIALNNPVQITTSTAHGLVNNQKIVITGVVGTTQLNTNTYYAKISTSTVFTLYSDSSLSTSVNGTGMTAYTSGGVVTGAAATGVESINGQTGVATITLAGLESAEGTIAAAVTAGTAGMATQTYVTSQGFATQTYVTSQGYQTAAQVTALADTSAASALSSYTVKSLVAGSGIQVANNAGAVTVTADAATAVAPTGSITMWAGPGDQVPTGWKLCNGQALNGDANAGGDAAFAALFNVIGTTYGGTGLTSYQLPNLVDKFVYGTSDTLASPIRGTTGGATTTQLSQGMLPAHTHDAGTFKTEAHSHDPGSLTTSPHSHSSGSLETVPHTHHTVAMETTGTRLEDTSESFFTHTRTNSYSLGSSSLTPTRGSTGVAKGTDVTATGQIDISGSTSEQTLPITSGTTAAKEADILGTSSSTGSGDAVPIVPPFIKLNYIIKL